MSDTGLYTGIYQHIHHYADLVDKVLISLKNNAPPDKSMRDELGAFLTKLGGDEYDDPSTRLTILVFHGSGEIAREEMVNSGQKLLEGAIDPELIKLLEKFAQLLEQQQHRALSRIQRWAR